MKKLFKERRLVDGAGVENMKKLFKKRRLADGAEMKPVFDLAVDRTYSLLERWQNFYDNAAKDHHTDEALQVLQDKCLLGLMSELSDPFIQSLIEEVNKRISTDAQ